MNKQEILSLSRTWLASKTGERASFPFFGYKDDNALLSGIEKQAKNEGFTVNLESLDLIDLHRVLEIMLFA